MDGPAKVFIDNALAQQDNIACLGIGKYLSSHAITVCILQSSRKRQKCDRQHRI